MTEAQRDDYLAQALRQRLVKRVAMWRIPTTDEDGIPMFLEFSTRKNAEEELDDADDGTIEKFDGFAATPKLDERWRRYFTRSLDECGPNVDHDQVATLALLMDEDLYDGVWWYDKYDPYGLSAPRGVIFPTRIKSWKRRREGAGSNT